MISTYLDRMFDTLKVRGNVSDLPTRGCFRCSIDLLSPFHYQ